MIHITEENASNFGPGSKVEFNFGAMSADREGVVTRIETIPASKFFEAQTRLWAEYEDEDGEAVETTINSFVTSEDVSPIGVRLIAAKPAQGNSKSPWAA